MNFTEKEQEHLALEFKRLRARLCCVKEMSNWLSKVAEGRPHITQRFEQLAAMSDEELMQEIEADYVLFNDY